MPILNNNLESCPAICVVGWKFKTVVRWWNPVSVFMLYLVHLLLLYSLCRQVSWFDIWVFPWQVMILSVVEVVDVGMWIKLREMPKEVQCSNVWFTFRCYCCGDRLFFFVRYVLGKTFILKIINFKKYLVGCGDFSVFVYKETESQEVVWTFTGSCGGLLWPQHPETWRQARHHIIRAWKACPEEHAV